MIRIARKTFRVALVTALVAISCRTARGGEPAPTPEGDLRLAGRIDAPVSDRIAAARRLVRSGVPDAESGVRAAALLLPNDPPTAAALLRRSLDADVVPADTMDLARATVRTALAKEAEPARKASLAAFALGVGLRTEFDAALDHPLPEVVEAAAADGYDLPLGVPSASRHADWAAHARFADLLDRANSDDPATARAGIDALATPEAVPFLRSVARLAPAPEPVSGPRPAALRTPRGRLPRRVRAIVALGLAGDRGAVPDLIPCVDDLQDDGPARFAAVTALGDLGDPRAIPALCRVIYYLGDVHRPRDSWDYPGADNTDVPADRWDSVEYYAIDVAAADALLRLGVGNAAEWLIRERLAVRTGRWRIRVLQDAVDALHRAFPDAPKVYEPDAGVPARAAAYDALVAWWRTGPRLARPLSETDDAVRTATRQIVATIGGKSVMELQIAKRAAALLGPPMLPAVLEGLSTSTRKVQRAELALVLGTLGDRRAVEPLLALTTDPVPAVRGNAILALARFVGTEADPRLVGEARDATDRIVARALAMLSDPEGAPRTAALETLAHARPRDDVRAALEAHAAASHAENAFGDYRMTEDVVRLVQTGEGAAGVLAHLEAKDLFVRRFVYELLRSAFDLEPDAYDPALDPGTPKHRAFDAAILARALAARRGAR